MPVKTLILSLVLAALPVIGLAQGCRNGTEGDDQALSCLPGTQWDVAAAGCIPVASS